MMNLNYINNIEKVFSLYIEQIKRKTIKIKRETKLLKEQNKKLEEELYNDGPL